MSRAGGCWPQCYILRGRYTVGMNGLFCPRAKHMRERSELVCRRPQFSRCASESTLMSPFAVPAAGSFLCWLAHPLCHGCAIKNAVISRDSDETGRERKI